MMHIELWWGMFGCSIARKGYAYQTVLECSVVPLQGRVMHTKLCWNVRLFHCKEGWCIPNYVAKCWVVPLQRRGDNTDICYEMLGCAITRRGDTYRTMLWNVGSFHCKGDTVECNKSKDNVVKSMPSNNLAANLTYPG